MIAEFIKFCVVGGSGVGVDFGITYLLKEKARINKYIANSAGSSVLPRRTTSSTASGTFANHDPAITQQYLTFLGISVVGLGINNGIIYLLADRMRMNFYLSKLFAIGTVTVWNFFMNYYFTFTA